MKSLSVIFILFVSINIYSQNKNINDDLIIDPIEQYPVFTGGEEAFSCFLESSFNYERLNLGDSTGRVIVQFEIDTLGNVVNININPQYLSRVKGLVKDTLVEYEIMRVFKLAPKWKPPLQNGKKIETKMSIIIKIPYTHFKCLQYKTDDSVCKDVDVLPDFRGFEGITKRDRINNFINSKLIWPDIEADCAGFVFVQCIVECDGKLSNFKLIRNLCSELNEEALRVVKLMPNWTPAIKDGQKVRSLVTIPVLFFLK
ncbi:MAG: energy transducer TonB [Bacteroidota bacterium]|nr:energy transducer TonB [Bacteroidota bacterium]